MDNYGFSAFSLFNNLEKNNKNEDVIIFNAGFYQARFSAFSCQRPERNYLMIYQHIGNSLAVFNGEKYYLSPGNIFIYPPKSNIDIKYFDDNINERYYIFFNGKKISEILSNLSINHVFLKVGLCQEFINATNSLISELRKPNYGNKTIKDITLLNLFLAISNLHEKNKEVTNLKDSVIAPALSYMHNHLGGKALSLNEYAKMCSISKSTFTKYFKISTNQTPTYYFTNLKISAIKQQLIETNKNISELSYEFGFDDPLYLSRIFKSYTGSSPANFRKLFKNNVFSSND